MALDELEDAFRLSPVQAAMLFQHAAAKDGRAYVEQLSFSVRGPVDAELMEGCWRRVVAAQPMLRSVFIWKGVRSPVQVALLREANCWRCEDLRSLSAMDREAAIGARSEAELRRGFEVDRLSLSRVTAFQVGEDLWRLVWTAHHLIVDGWSMQVVLRDWTALLVGGTSTEERRCRGIVKWRQYLAWLESMRLAGQEFWTDRFRLEAGIYPSESARKRSGAYSERHVELEDLLPSLKDAAKAKEVSLATYIHLAFARALSRIFASEHIIFGTAVSGRKSSFPDILELVGPLATILPVRYSSGNRGVEDSLVIMEQELRTVESADGVALSDIARWIKAVAVRRVTHCVLSVQNHTVLQSKNNSAVELTDFRIRLSRTQFPVTVYVGVGHHATATAVYDAEWMGDMEIGRLLSVLVEEMQTLLNNDCSIQEAGGE